MKPQLMAGWEAVLISVKVCDARMGLGKTTAAIKYMSETDGNFVFVTPYKEEYERIIDGCYGKPFCTPIELPNKTTNIMTLLEKQENIASTHALFARYTPEIVELIHAGHYTLIMDEVFDIFQEQKYTAGDVADLIGRQMITVQSITGKVQWTDEEYAGTVYQEAKNMADDGKLYCYRDSALFTMFPPEIFKAFDNVIVLTYMFNSQWQRYYFDINGIEYSYISVRKIAEDKYEFCSVADGDMVYVDMSSLIAVIDGKRGAKLNSIGDDEYALSTNKLTTASSEFFDLVGRNIYNALHNRFHAAPPDAMWTIVNDVKDRVDTRRYAKMHISCTARATNKYKDIHNMAYIRNVRMRPYIKNYLISRGCVIKQPQEDGYAIAELLQWMWRSAIRQGQHINLYLPSHRMRRLLYRWMDDISNGREVRERISI